MTTIVKTLPKRQLDIPLTSGFYFVIPTDVKGRLTSEDYINFKIDGINKELYDVAIETIQEDFRTISHLNEVVRLPHVQIPQGAFVLVLPRNSLSLPKFIGTIDRGKTYYVSTKNAKVKDFYLLK